MLHDAVKSSDVSPIDELEDFAMGRVRNNTDGCPDVHYARDVKERPSAKANKYKEAEDAARARRTQRNSADDLESFFSMSSRSSSVPKSRATPSVRTTYSKQFMQHQHYSLFDSCCIC